MDGPPPGSRRLTNGTIELEILTSSGPRITSYALVGRASPLVRVPDLHLPVGDGRNFAMIGGHRLWVAPEVPAVTYLPDDVPCLVEERPGGVAVTQPALPETGIERRLEVLLRDGSTQVALTHLLTNRGDAVATVAAWAITMLHTGGRAYLPLGGWAPTGLQADRALILWPYTTLHDPQIEYGDRLVSVEAARSDAAKVGTILRRGWLAYSWEGLVFIKRARHEPGGRYADLGASGQIYCNDRFCELETLSPLTELAPGESLTHHETWDLHLLEGGTDRDILERLDDPP